MTAIANPCATGHDWVTRVKQANTPGWFILPDDGPLKGFAYASSVFCARCTGLRPGQRVRVLMAALLACPGILNGDGSIPESGPSLHPVLDGDREGEIRQTGYQLWHSYHVWFDDGSHMLCNRWELEPVAL